MIKRFVTRKVIKKTNKQTNTLQQGKSQEPLNRPLWA